MERDKLPREIDAPTKPCLGVFSKSMTIMPIPPGAVMAVVMDASKNEIYPMVLRKVSLKKLEFQCACGSPDCTRTITFATSMRGMHPLRGRQ